MKKKEDGVDNGDENIEKEDDGDNDDEKFGRTR